jgi:hypothetical protein
MTTSQKEFFLTTLVILGFVLWMGKDFYETIHKTPNTKIEVVYDCRLAEISPDFPASVKERCRKLMRPKVRAVL